MSRKWTKEEDKKLIALCEKGCSVKTIVKTFDRSENACRLRACKLGVTIYTKGRRWTKEETEAFIKEWTDETISNNCLVSRHHRTWHALQEKAVQLSLGPRREDSSYLTVSDICQEMQVSSDRVYRWIDLGLKTYRGGSARRKYLIAADDLLEFLSEHPSLFDASLVSFYIFAEEPEWLQAKRKSDFLMTNKKHQYEWTREEDAELQSLYQRGVSYDVLAQRFKRSVTAIKTHLYVIGCEARPRSNLYTKEELDFLQDMSDKMTLQELADVLPGRTAKGLEYKCKMLGLPYHLSKNCCND